MAEVDITKLTPSIRHLNDMKAVVMDQEWAATAENFEMYYMYRAVKEENELIHNITVIPARMMGKEFTKTKGHVHIGNYGETYTVLEGEAIFFMQNYDNDMIEDVYAIRAKKGESVIIPPGYGHITINLGNSDLKTGDWSSINCKGDYSLFEKMQGGCYYFTTDGWIKNEHYKNVPELRFEEPLKELPKNLDFLKG